MNLNRYKSSMYSGSFTGPELSFMKQYGVVTTFYAPHNPELEKLEIKRLKRDAKIFQDGVTPYKVPVDIKISEITEPFSTWNLYPPLNEEDKSSLKTSIYTYGVMCPLIIYREFENQYMVVSGYERLKIVYELYEETCEIRFETLPCIIIENHEVNEWIIRDIMIDSILLEKETLLPQ